VKPAPFELHVPATTTEVVDILATHQDESKVLAGGQSLVPMLALRLARPGVLVDINRIREIAGVGYGDGEVRVGALTRHAELEHDAGLASQVPLLARAAPLIGHFQIRNRGTVGGSIAHADPSAELPAVALALDATLEVAAPGGRRRVPASEFFEGTFVTAVQDTELLAAVEFPVWGDGSGFAVEEMARRHGDFALVGAMCGVRIANGSIAQAAIAMFGVGSTPVRCGTAEAQLVGSSAEGLDTSEIGRAAVADLDPPTDVHASAAYRKAVGVTLVDRALRSAIQEASRA